MSLSPENLNIMAGISHEIRNPINSVIGIAHLLQTEERKEVQEELLETLLQVSENLRELTNNILDFTKLEAGVSPRHISVVDLRKEVPVVLYGLITLARSKGLDLVIDIADNVPKHVLFDRVRGMQILGNLVSNALKFTEKGSVIISIKAGKLQDGKVTLNFSVKDTGIGIAEENQKRIFEPFRQGDSSIGTTFGGTGLGLSIANRLLTSVGGELRLKSRPGEGSEFYFDVILGTPKVEPPISDRKEAFLPDFPRMGKVLIVDDNEINLLIAGKKFETWNINFVLARSGPEALELVQLEDFSVVLMDLHMPGMGGIEVANAIRNLPGEKFLDLPIIALSGVADIGQPEEIKSAGFTDFLSKPYSPQELLQKIAKVVAIENSPA